MTKLCPACLATVRKGELDCSSCGYDMRRGPAEESSKGPKLAERPSGAALIRAWGAGGKERTGGWIPVRQVWTHAGETVAAAGEGRYILAGVFADRAADARWIRASEGGDVEALLLANGLARTSARQVTIDGAEMVVPMPQLSVDSRGEGG